MSRERLTEQQAVFRQHLLNVLGNFLNHKGKPLSDSLGHRLLTFRLSCSALTDGDAVRLADGWAKLVSSFTSAVMRVNGKSLPVAGRLASRLLQNSLPYLEVGEGGLVHLHVQSWEPSSMFDASEDGRKRWRYLLKYAKLYLGASSVHRGPWVALYKDGKREQRGQYAAYRIHSYCRKDGPPLAVPSADLSPTRQEQAERILEDKWTVYRLNQVEDKLGSWHPSFVSLERTKSGQSSRWSVSAAPYKRSYGNMALLTNYLKELSRCSDELDLNSRVWRVFDTQDRIRSLMAGNLQGFEDSRGTFYHLYRNRKEGCLESIRSDLVRIDNQHFAGTYRLAEKAGRDIRMLRHNGRLVPMDLDCDNADDETYVEEPIDDELLGVEFEETVKRAGK